MPANEPKSPAHIARYHSTGIAQRVVIPAPHPRNPASGITTSAPIRLRRRFSDRCFSSNAVRRLSSAREADRSLRGAGGTARAAEPKEREDGRAIVARRSARGSRRVAIDHAQAGRGDRTPDDARETAGMGSGERLGRDLGAGDQDLSAEPHVEAERGEIRAWRVDPEDELADGVGTVGGDALESPRLTFDGDGGVIGSRDRAAEGRTDDPPAHERRREEIAA